MEGSHRDSSYLRRNRISFTHPVSLHLSTHHWDPKDEITVGSRITHAVKACASKGAAGIPQASLRPDPTQAAPPSASIQTRRPSVSMGQRRKGRREMPWEIIYEILSRTSLRVLYTSRLVCRDWGIMIRDPSFINFHSRRTPTLSGVFLQYQSRRGPTRSGVFYQYHLGFRTGRTFISPTASRKNEVLSLNFAPDSGDVPVLSLNFEPDSGDVRVLASSDLGLLYCLSCSLEKITLHYVYYLGICKPTTKQWQSIPFPFPTLLYTPLFAALLITDTSPLQYKIIHAVSSNLNDVSFYVFDSNKWKWRPAGGISDQNVQLDAAQAAGVLIRGTVHWLFSDFRILTFDGYSETSQIRESPCAVDPGPDLVRIVEYQGMLAYVRIRFIQSIGGEEGNAVEIELWVLENYSDGWGVWNKRHALSLNFTSCTSLEPPVTLDGNTLALVCDRPITTTTLCINFTTRQTILWMLPGESTDTAEVMSFRSDWEPCHLAMHAYPRGNNVDDLKEDG